MIRRLSTHGPMISRIACAAIGGYLLTSGLTLLLTLALSALGLDRGESLFAITIASFFAYAAIIMAVFHASSATRAWAWLMAAAVPTGVASLCLLRMGAAS